MSHTNKKMYPILSIALSKRALEKGDLDTKEPGRLTVVDVFTKESRGHQFDVDRIPTWYRNHKRKKSKLSQDDINS